MQLPIILTLKCQIEVQRVFECVFLCFTAEMLYILFPDLDNTTYVLLRLFPFDHQPLKGKKKIPSEMHSRLPQQSLYSLYPMYLHFSFDIV
jgi:hypothetical protein